MNAPFQKNFWQPTSVYLKIFSNSSFRQLLFLNSFFWQPSLSILLANHLANHFGNRDSSNPESIATTGFERKASANQGK
jgi:hypothetical protein